MASNLLSRYIWIVDTLRRYGRMTRAELADRWRKSSVSGGNELARRTFYNYRNAIAELFGINIECDPATFEYYIDSADEHSSTVTDWMLNQTAMGQIMGDAADVASRIFVDDVPSARQWLSVAIAAIKEGRTLHFSYLPYTRVNPRHGNVLEPYFLKIFRQRWYVTGRNVQDNAVKTYALDRMTRAVMGPDTFEMPADFDPEAYCRDSFGIMFTKGPVHDVVLKVTTRQAKYFRALPLHHSQRETIHDTYSIFRYRLRITGDLVSDILSYAPEVTVLAPRELRVMVTSRLRAALADY